MSTLKATNIAHGSSGSNNIVLDSGGDVTVTNDLLMNSDYGSATKVYGCRAFGILEQTDAHSWYINRGFNASITDLGDGHSGISFSFTMPDINYCVIGTQTFYTSTSTGARAVVVAANQTTTGFEIDTEDVDSFSVDTNVAIAVFR